MILMFKSLAPEEVSAALACKNHAGETVESFIQNQKTLKTIKALILKEERVVISRKGGDEPQRNLEWPFWSAKRPRVVYDVDSARPALDPSSMPQ